MHLTVATAWQQRGYKVTELPRVLPLPPAELLSRNPGFTHRPRRGEIAFQLGNAAFAQRRERKSGHRMRIRGRAEAGHLDDADGDGQGSPQDRLQSRSAGLRW